MGGINIKTGRLAPRLIADSQLTGVDAQMIEFCKWCYHIFNANGWFDHRSMKCSSCLKKEIRQPIECAKCKEKYRMNGVIATCKCFDDDNKEK